MLQINGSLREELAAVGPDSAQTNDGLTRKSCLPKPQGPDGTAAKWPT